MSKELEALERINKRFGIFSLDDISDFYLINEALTELEELKRDVKRFMELEENYQKSSHEYHEMEYIKNKLMKVGNEE